VQNATDAIISFFDHNQDGVIGFDEFVLIVIALSVPEKDVEVVFDVMDLDNNGVLDEGEFMQVGTAGTCRLVISTLCLYRSDAGCGGWREHGTTVVMWRSHIHLTRCGGSKVPACG
jgi:hypothetical protein